MFHGEREECKSNVTCMSGFTIEHADINGKTAFLETDLDSISFYSCISWHRHGKDQETTKSIIGQICLDIGRRHVRLEIVVSAGSETNGWMYGDLNK